MGGFKDFAQDEILTAEDVENYLMHQAVMVFDTDVDRDIALVGFLQSGFAAYTKSDNSLRIYDGSSWQRVPTYDELTALAAPTEIRKIILMDVKDPIILYVPDYFLFDGCEDLWCAWGFW